MVENGWMSREEDKVGDWSFGADIGRLQNEHAPVYSAKPWAPAQVPALLWFAGQALIRAGVVRCEVSKIAHDARRIPNMPKGEW
jgi:hypothetical protein